MVLGRIAKLYLRGQDNSTFSLTLVTANASVAPFVPTTVDVPYPKRFHTHAQNVQSVGGCNVFQNKVVTLNSGKFAVFDDTLDSFVWFSFVLCLLTRGLHHGSNGMCVNSRFIFSHSVGSQGMVIGSAPASTAMLPSSTGPSTIGCTIASSRLDEPHEMFEFCNPPTCTHLFCGRSTRTHDFFESLTRTL